MSFWEPFCRPGNCVLGPQLLQESPVGKWNPFEVDPFSGFHGEEKCGRQCEEGEGGAVPVEAKVGRCPCCMIPGQEKQTSRCANFAGGTT